MRHSTKAKHTNVLRILVNGECKLYPNERVKRYPKFTLVLGTKEETKLEAQGIQQATIRDARYLNKAQEQLPLSQRRSYSVCKEYIKAEEATKRLEENLDDYLYPPNHYFKDTAGWVFWLQENPSQEELFDMRYQDDAASPDSTESQYKL